MNILFSIFIRMVLCILLFAYLLNLPYLLLCVYLFNPAVLIIDVCSQFIFNASAKCYSIYMNVMYCI